MNSRNPYYNPDRGCNEREMIKFYTYVDKQRLDKAVTLLMKRYVYTLVDGDRFFVNSKQGRGIYVFTDAERAHEFLAQEENRTFRTSVQKIPFSVAWLTQAAEVERCDFYINLTPYGCRHPFLVWRHDDDNWQTGTKDKNLRFTLPYNLTPRKTNWVADPIKYDR